jgi:hypothetical protein
MRRALVVGLLLVLAAAALSEGCSRRHRGRPDRVAPLAAFDVVIGDAAVTPSRFYAVSGEPVRFVNRTTGPVAVRAADNAFKSGPLPPGSSWILPSAPPGVHTYSAGGLSGVLDVAR